MKSFKTMLAGAVLSALAVCSLAADAAALADRHVARGLKCDMCHVSQPMKTVKQDQCLKCHGGSYEALAKRTDDKDINPHDSHIETPECTQCHSGHGKPRLLCDECHEFTGMKVP
mgnify:FL=1